LGLFVYAFIEYYTIMTARRAGAQAAPAMRRDLLAYVFGMMAVSIAVMFVDLTTANPYLWMYVGLVMRGAVLVFDEAEAAHSPAPERAPRLHLGVGVSLRKA